MAIKTSRRAIFRSLFGRTGFELDLDTANEILMRLNRSMDPIPVAAEMWTSYRTNRRPLRYSGDERPRETARADIAFEVDAAVAHADFSEFPEHVARQLVVLLRIEALLRMGAAASGAAPGPPSPGPRRRDVLRGLEAEIQGYVQHDGTDDFPPELVDALVTYLARVAGMDRPSPPSRS